MEINDNLSLISILFLNAISFTMYSHWEFLSKLLILIAMDISTPTFRQATTFFQGQSLSEATTIRRLTIQQVKAWGQILIFLYQFFQGQSLSEATTIRRWTIQKKVWLGNQLLKAWTAKQMNLANFCQFTILASRRQCRIYVKTNEHLSLWTS